MTTTAAHAFVSAFASGTSAIPFDFQAIAEDEVGVTLDGVEVDPTDFNVTLNGDSTGFVYPLSDWGAGEVVIYSKPLFQQPYNFARFGPFYPDQFVAPLDRLARGQIALAEDTRRSIKGPLGTEGLSIDNTPNTVLGTDDTGAIMQLDASAFQGEPGEPGADGDASNLKIKTPYDYGAVGANLANLDASTDDGIALQAFFTAMHDPLVGPYYKWSWRGAWATSIPLYAINPLVNTGTLNVEYHGRSVECGSLHVLPVASQPGGVPMNAVLTIGGPYTQWTGHCFIHAGDRGTANYIDRRFKRGIRFIQASQSTMEKLTVVSSKKAGVWVDAQFETWNETSIGAPYATGSTSKNNIGLNILDCTLVNCGPTTQFGLTTGRALALAVSSQTQGGDPGQDGGFAAGSAGYENNGEQRTRVTLSSATTEVETGDWIMRRTERVPADYTTISADNATGKFTFTANTPASHGLAVDVEFVLEDAGSVGVNDGVTFKVKSIAGQDVFVYPAPTTEAAKAYSKLTTAFSLHRVLEVIDSTKFTVFPWIPDSANSSVYIVSGGLKVSGNDAAGVRIGSLKVIWSGIGLANETLYGVDVDSYVFDFCDIGVAHGINTATATIGLTLGHGHSEAVRYDFVQILGPWGNFKYSADSAFSGNIVMLDVRGATTSQLQRSDRPFNFDIQIQGSRYTNKWQQSRFNSGSLDNTPNGCRRVFLTDVSASPLTCTLSFDEQAYRLGHEIAEALVQSYLGGAPTGAFTFALDATMISKGWTITGDTVVTSPNNRSFYRVHFNRTDKIVTITLVGGVKTDSGPWSGYSGVSFSSRGGGEYDVTKTDAAAWQGQAWFRIDDDYRMRIQPLQTTSLMSIGVDNAGALTADNGTMDAFIYFLTGPALYQPYKTGYTADTASSSASFAANDYFWLERRGAVLRMFKGGPNFGDADLVWTHTVDVSGSDYAKLLIRDAGAALRVKLFAIPEEPKIVTPSATYTEKLFAGERIVLATGTWTLNLPTAVANKGKLTVKAVTGTITLDGAGSETIDGSATLALTVGQYATIVSDGTNWVRVA